MFALSIWVLCYNSRYKSTSKAIRVSHEFQVAAVVVATIELQRAQSRELQSTKAVDQFTATLKKNRDTSERKFAFNRTAF